MRGGETHRGRDFFGAAALLQLRCGYFAVFMTARFSRLMIREHQHLLRFWCLAGCASFIRLLSLSLGQSQGGIVVQVARDNMRRGLPIRDSRYQGGDLGWWKGESQERSGDCVIHFIRLLVPRALFTLIYS